MRKQSLCHLWLMVAVLLALLSPQSSQAQVPQEEVVVAVPANWPPQYLRDPGTGNPTGFAVDIMDEVARLSGLKIRYEVFDSWPKVHQAVMDGRALVVPDLGITDERVKDYDFTIPIEVEHIRIFVRESNTDILGVESLAGRKVGVVEFNKGRHLMEARNESELVIFSSFEEAFLALLSGNVDAMIYPEKTVWMMAKVAGLDHQIKTAGPSLLEVKRGMAVRKGNPELLQILDETLWHLEQTATYRDIYSKWFKAPEPYWSVQRVATLMGGLLAVSVVILAAWRHVAVSRMNKILRASIRERERVEQALRKNQSQLRAIFQNVAAGIAVLSPAGRYLEINDKWGEMLGYSKKEIVGKTLMEMTFPADAEECRQRFNDLTANRVEGYRIEKRYLRKDGSLFWADLSMTRTFDPAGGSEALIAVILDVTEAKKTEDKLKRANRELESFVYTVSHDLRSPLTGIIGFADFLLEKHQETFDGQLKDCLGEIAKGGRKMQSLMEDLLALAKVGKVETPDRPTDASRVMQEVLKELSKRFDGVENRVRCAGLPEILVPDTLLSQVFLNLVGNALHYAGDGGQAIEVGGERDGKRVTYFVRDHGPGISADERDSIFEVFFRGSSGSKIKGTGIGLAIVQKIARLYGGRAWVVETPGGGSTFWVELCEEEPPAPLG